MSEQKDVSENTILIKTILFFKRWFKLLLIIGVVSFGCALALSFLIKPRYKSSTILMPTATSSLSRPVFTKGYYKEDYLEYGMEKDCEYMMQILKSPEIASAAISHFDLCKHWEIKENDPKRYARAQRKLDKELTIRRTENLGVQITIEDQDPQLAADLANFIVDQYDTLRNKMREERGKAACNIGLEMQERIISEMQVVEDSLQSLRKSGVMNYEHFTERMYEEMAKYVGKGDQAGVKRIEDKLQVYADLGGKYVNMSEYLNFKREQLADIETRLAQLYTDAENVIPYKFVVSKAAPDEFKSYPKRLSLALTISIFTTLFAVFCLFFIEKWNEIKKQIV